MLSQSQAEDIARAGNKPGTPGLLPNRLRIAFIAAGVLLLLAAGAIFESRYPLAGVAVRREAGANVLLITVDTLRADALGCYGNARAVTPWMDRLAAAGTRFDLARAHNVVTLPSHVNILSGRYPLAHGVRDNSGFRFPPGRDTLATILKARGYRTAAFVSAFPVASRFGLGRGFDLYDDSFVDATAGQPFVVQERSGRETVARAKRWIEGAGRDQPWLVWVHLYEPHYPYAPPEPFAARFRSDLYAGDVAAADAALAPLLEPLLADESARRTLIVLTGDHGESLGEHGEATHGIFGYEAVLRVPLIFCDTHLPTGRVVHEAVRHVDVLPTILEALAVPMPADLDGESLLPLVEGLSGRSAATYFEALSGTLNRGSAAIVPTRLGRIWNSSPPRRRPRATNATSRAHASGSPGTVRGIPEGWVVARAERHTSGATAPNTHRWLRCPPPVKIGPAVNGGKRVPHGWLVTGVLLLAAWTAFVRGEDQPRTSARPRASLGAATDPMSAVRSAVSAAESALRDGELQIAESRYRTALFHAWMLEGGLDIAEARLPDAREAFLRASTSTVEPKEALQSLALVELRLGNAPAAVDVLTRVAGADPKDLYTRRMLAQALVASGQPEQGVQELEEAYAARPDDLELAFLLASGYLSLKKIDAAAHLFATIASARPTPQTHVLIGRTYRDAGEYGRARSALLTALKQDPRTRRAHYYLGTIAVLEEGAVRLDEAIAEFRKELGIAPGDSVATLRLGMALVEAQRPADALPALKAATESASAPADAFHYFGRCLLALDRPEEAIPALRRALDLSQGEGADELRLLGIHYQLGQALRRIGAQEEAAAHFAQAEQMSARRADSSRERLTRYLADIPDPRTAGAPVVSFMDSVQLGASPLSTLAPDQRTGLRRRLKDVLARSYLNLGIMRARSGRFSRAAEFFENASAVDADFPEVQYSLGITYFNAQKYDKAAMPLTRAFALNPADDTLRRMLALACLKTDAYEKAAELLAADANSNADPSLQYAYGLALVRSNRAAEAEKIFARLLAQHGDTAELNVVVGQAHAQQGDYEGAIASLTRALALKPDVADANGTLGVIYMRQGKLTEATAALRAELKAHPADFKTRHTLATVLDLDGHQDEALAEVRAALKVNPEFADARYLLGKILLARGSADEAVESLEAAVRLAPDEPNIHYQLGQAYQKLGRSEQARQEFEAFQRLKDKHAGRLQ